MKLRILGSTLAMCCLAVLCAGAQEGPERDADAPRRRAPDAGMRRAMPPPQVQNEFELRKQRLAIEERESELRFKNEMRKLDLEQRRAQIQGQEKGNCHRRGRFMHCIPMVVICALVHILLSVWVYQDIRKRNAGSGIWIVLAMLTGFFGTLLYAVVRAGDSKQT